MTNRILLLSATVLFLSSCGANLRMKLELTRAPEDVPMSGKVSERDFSDPSSFTFPLTQAWEYDASAGFGAGAPVIIGSTLITGTLQGELHAVDMNTGKSLRYIKNVSPIASSPAVYQRYIIFGMESTEENLVSIDTYDGTVRWEKDAGGVASSPMLKDDLLYVGGLDGTFRCLEAAYGTVKWRAETGAPIRSSPCAWNNLVYCANASGVVKAFDAEDGNERWSFTTGNAVFAGLTAAEGKLFVGSRDSNLYILDAETGALLRKIAFGDKLMASPSVSGGILFVPCMDGSVTAFTIADGTVRWKFQTKSAVNTTPVATPGALFVASLDQHIYALSPMDGSLLWKQPVESRIKTTPLVWKNSLIIASEDKYIRCFR
jgi:outer membrane protein assembly factor BamB